MDKLKLEYEIVEALKYAFEQEGDSTYNNHDKRVEMICRVEAECDEPGYSGGTVEIDLHKIAMAILEHFERKKIALVPVMIVHATEV